MSWLSAILLGSRAGGPDSHPHTCNELEILMCAANSSVSTSVAAMLLVGAGCHREVAPAPEAKPPKLLVANPTFKSRTD